ncbi:MAG TPA: carbonic anhydrase [Polyangiaceae bacterium]|nr:carbonic anhydrase [Polyangiaceae bacterium]
MRRLLALIPLALLVSGCDKLVGDARADEGKPHPAQSAAPAPAKSAVPVARAAPELSEPGTRYGIPFAWEVEKDEPLAKARAYLGELLTDNAANAQLGKQHFAPLAEKQAPRATVVACADSRVQASAWDATPENDVFTIRNIGNQLTTAHGSVEYGLEHLHTPVLIVLGHTGCGAVKAAMGKLDELEPPIKSELSGMKLPPPNPKANERRAWADAVVANVNQQVDFAVGHYGKLLREQRVLVVGAVYDFRNDLGRGFGRISIVNVNGNTDTKRLRAFELALGTPVPSNAEPAAPEPAREARNVPGNPEAAGEPEGSGRREGPSTGEAPSTREAPTAREPRDTGESTLAALLRQQAEMQAAKEAKSARPGAHAETHAETHAD